MTENTPIIPIPLPDYNSYKSDICDRYKLTLPLKSVSFYQEGILRHLPPPLQKNRSGWPWTNESEVTFKNEKTCPKLSVVIPSYEQGQFLEETIRSVLLQNYPNTELIIMDGGSSDETVLVLEHYRRFISFAVSEKDKGQSHAINKGFSIAAGEIFYWLNSDDYLTKDALNKVIVHFNDNQMIDIVYGDGMVLHDATGQIEFAPAPVVLDRYLRMGGIVLSHSVLWRKRVHCPIWENLNCAMDAELWLRLFNRRKSKHIHIPIGVFRVHADQKTSDGQKWSARWTEDFERYIWRHYAPINRLKWRWRCVLVYFIAIQR
jgi:glycosyltransferase involved in cell wall biosynthesis